jgi:PAS domain-containing protein
MHTLSHDPVRLTDLRSRAASRLPGSKSGAARATDALAVLHSLASSPDTAADALTLLHELQVLQVELDMQAEELRESRVELEGALRRQTELYDFQPVACFTVDARCVVHELNVAGATLLGVEREDAYGMSLDTFIASGGKLRFPERVANPVVHGLPTSCVLTLRALDGAEQRVQAHIAADPATPRFFVTLTTLP